MSNQNIIGALVVVLLSTGLSWSEETGKICYVAWAPKAIDPIDYRAVLVLDGKETMSMINKPNASAPNTLYGVGKFPMIMAEGLDLAAPHMIELKADGKTWETWTFRFKGPSHMINFWRSAGYWHLEQSPTPECKSLEQTGQKTR